MQRDTPYSFHTFAKLKIILRSIEVIFKRVVTRKYGKKQTILSAV